MENSRIEWTTHTWNPWIGCTKISPGCANCYAWYLMAIRMKRVQWGKGHKRGRTSAAYWRRPFAWDADAKARGVRTKVFCASLADWLDEEVEIEWFAEFLDVVRRTTHLDWQLLTKRPWNWIARISAAAAYAANKARDILSPTESNRLFDLGQWLIAWMEGHAPANVWAGTSVENQDCADKRIPELLKIPARVRFLSCEPLLGPVSLVQWLYPEGRCGECLELIRVRRDSVSCGCCCEGPEPTLERTDLIDWVICGGESGHDARPMHPEWARELRDECKGAGVPFLFKQWGEWIPVDQSLPGTKIGPADAHPGCSGTVLQLNGREEFAFPPGAMTCLDLGKKITGRLLDGVEHNGFPE